jgi:hypothetical protein
MHSRRARQIPLVPASNSTSAPMASVSGVRHHGVEHEVYGRLGGRPREPSSPRNVPLGRPARALVFHEPARVRLQKVIVDGDVSAGPDRTCHGAAGIECMLVRPEAPRLLSVRCRERSAMTTKSTSVPRVGCRSNLMLVKF